MPSIHRKLKLAHVWPDYPDGPRLSVTTVDGEILDLMLTATAAAALQKQLADVVAQYLKADGWGTA